MTNYRPWISKGYLIKANNDAIIISDIIQVDEPIKSIYLFTSNYKCEIIDISSTYMNKCGVKHNISKNIGVIKIDIKNDEHYTERERSSLQIIVKVKNNSQVDDIKCSLNMMIKFDSAKIS